MPIASNLGLSPLPLPLIVPMALGLGGNAVTVSRVLHAAMLENGATDDADAGKAGHALKAVIADRKVRGEPSISFAVVHPYSGHNFELRYWLAGNGIDPEEDVTIVVVPPPLMVDALASATQDIQRQEDLVNREIDLLREYRTRLIADVVTGKVDVRAAAVALPEVEPEVEDDEPLDEDDDDQYDDADDVDDVDEEDEG